MECPRRLEYQCYKAKVEVAYISHPNISGRGFQKEGWMTCVPACANLFSTRANLCATPTYALHQLMHCAKKTRQHTFGCPLTWPYPYIKVGKTR